MILQLNILYLIYSHHKICIYSMKYCSMRMISVKFLAIYKKFFDLFVWQLISLTIRFEF